jgi:hypothetical protein
MAASYRESPILVELALGETSEWWDTIGPGGDSRLARRNRPRADIQQLTLGVDPLRPTEQQSLLLSDPCQHGGPSYETLKLFR